MPHQKLSGSSPKSATAASDEERFRGSKVWDSSLTDIECPSLSQHRGQPDPKQC